MNLDTTRNGLAHALIYHELEAALGRERVSDDADALQAEAADWSWLSQFLKYRGRSVPAADIAVWPTTSDEVAEIVRIADHYRVPVVTRGGGSGTQGGTIAPYGGIALGLSRMNRVIEIDETSMTVTVEAGKNGWELEQELNARGLTLPHYPGSMHHGATVGGYVAARGSGVVSTKYGKAEDLVMQVRAVVPPGKIISTLPVPNHAVGPDLLQIFVGSEGTLGVITEVTMQIVPLPEERSFLSFSLADVATGIALASQVMKAGWRPATMRLYDDQDARRLGRAIGQDIAGALMIVMCEGTSRLVDAEVEAIRSIFGKIGSEDLGPALAQRWWDKKYMPFASGHMPTPPTIFGTMDSCATFAKLPALYQAKRSLVEEGLAHLGAKYTAHFSHWYPWGGMIYDRFYVENGPEDPREAIALHDHIWDKAIAVSLAHGGIVNEHHGIGLKLGRFMSEQYGSAFPLLTGLKAAWDPNGIMNPGKLGFGPPR